MITRIDYDRGMDGLYVDDAQPFADIKITNPELLRSIELAAKSSEPIDDEELQEIHYNGLLATRDNSIRDSEKDKQFTPQEVAVMRVFMARSEEWRYESDFMTLSPLYLATRPHPISIQPVSKPISRTRKKVMRQSAMTETVSPIGLTGTVAELGADNYPYWIIQRIFTEN